MKIQFKETPEQLELIGAMGSKDKAKAAAAQMAFANLIAPTLGTVYQQADTTTFLYRDFAYNTDDDPSFPIDLFANVPEGHFSIWSSPKPGGLPTNHISQSIDEVKFTTYRLDSAWSINSKYARKMRLPIVAKALQRLVQEVLLKTNYSYNRWNFTWSRFRFGCRCSVFDGRFQPASNLFPSPQLLVGWWNAYRWCWKTNGHDCVA